MATTKHLHVMMTAKASELQGSIQKIEGGLQKLQSSTSGLRGGMAALVGGANPFAMLQGGVKNLIGAIPGIGPALQGGLAVFESFFSKVRQTQKEIQNTGKSAKMVGASLEGYSALAYMASDAEAMDKAMFKLSDSVAEAALHAGPVEEAFQRLGLSARSLSALKTDEQFLKVAGALAKVENQSLKNKLAMDIFGKGALGVMAEINKGEAGLRKGMDLAKSHGAVISERDFAAVKQANLAMKQFDASIEAVWKRIAVNLAPLVKNVAEDMKLINGAKPADIASDKLGLSMMQWKFMFEDAIDMFSGKMGGPSALERAKDEMAKFAEGVEKAEKEAKKQAAALERAADEQKRLTEEAKRQEEIMKRTTAVIDAGIGPWDKFQAKLVEINAVMAFGKLTNDQYTMSLGALVREFDKLNEKKAESKSPEMVEFGSAADVSYGIKLQRDMQSAARDNGDRTVRVLEQIRDKQREMANDSKEVKESLKKLGLAK